VFVYYIWSVGSETRFLSLLANNFHLKYKDIVLCFLSLKAYLPFACSLFIKYSSGTIFLVTESMCRILCSSSHASFSLFLVLLSLFCYPSSMFLMPVLWSCSELLFPCSIFHVSCSISYALCLVLPILHFSVLLSFFFITDSMFFVPPCPNFHAPCSIFPVTLLHLVQFLKISLRQVSACVPKNSCLILLVPCCVINVPYFPWSLYCVQRSVFRLTCNI
jgi:hypothetical protein